MLIALVYQVGIANVFEVHQYVPNGARRPRPTRRLYQGDFRSAELFARGAAYAGAAVRSFACNRAGDVADEDWSTDLESAPFSDKFQPVNAR